MRNSNEILVVFGYRNPSKSFCRISQVSIDKCSSQSHKQHAKEIGQEKEKKKEKEREAGREQRANALKRPGSQGPECTLVWVPERRDRRGKGEKKNTGRGTERGGTETERRREGAHFNAAY